MRLLIGVTGGIAAYKALETIRLATGAGHSVRVVQTPTSQRFVGAASFAAITGAPVLDSEFAEDPARGAFPGEPVPAWAPISHLALVERADVYLIAPASANTLARLATGMADSLVSTAALAAACPVVVAPAMNHRMWCHPATRANVATLRGRGITVLDPSTGPLASHGEHGQGRLPDPAALLAAAEAAHAGALAAAAGDLAGVRVLVSAGGTQEPIDAVRFIGNHSSGRMGYAVAERAHARGAVVTVLSANVRLDPPAGVEVIRLRTAAELEAAAAAHFPAADVLVMAAAVADFRPARPVTHKLKKTGPELPTTLELERTTDILAALAAQRRADQLLVGFAAEHGAAAVALGREKLRRKDLDAVVVNDISRTDIGFDSAENEVTIVTADADLPVSKTSKEAVADTVLDTVVELRGRHPARAGGTPVGIAGD
ncbi:MAG TPA: bifunctional phosphopantothenoylcysteine decarboxylase/phosphopantothenate--cysteine ligase CoaBC [Solirubrobacteraceae bacterium]|nr:bifunctional phosphopantothenoylcysteine decarboxylase/phosphopantothenate--cysteine ligase CoaBC [Solirubrobacteraceae bacterium]